MTEGLSRALCKLILKRLDFAKQNLKLLCYKFESKVL